MYISTYKLILIPTNLISSHISLSQLTLIYKNCVKFYLNSRKLILTFPRKAIWTWLFTMDFQTVEILNSWYPYNSSNDENDKCIKNPISIQIKVKNPVDNQNQSFLFIEGWITKDLPILPKGQNYTILEHTVNCNGNMVYFSEFNFKGQPPVEVSTKIFQFRSWDSKG